MKQLEKFLEWGGTRREIFCLILSGAALLISMFDLLPLPFDAAWIAIVLCGIPIVLEAFLGLVTAFDIKADVLVSIALIASVLIGENFAAGEVAFIMRLGGLLEDLTVARARAGIEKLVRLTPRTARVIREEKETVIPAEQVQAGDVLRVLPGETVPADGVILSGRTSVNQAVMTGESLPVDKEAGDEVSSGTVNQFGAFEMKALRAGEDSSIQRMIRLVQSRGCREGKNSGACGPLGDLDRNHRPQRGRSDLAYQRGAPPGSNHSGSILPLRPGTGNSHCHYGSHWECDQAWISGARGRCPGASGRCFQDRL